MYLQALKIAARNQIRSTLLTPGLPIPYIDGAECQLTDPEGTPPPSTGQTFIGIHGGTIVEQAPPGSYFSKTVLSFNVTISWLRGFIHQDRGGDHLDDIDEGLDTQSDLIVQTLTLQNGFIVLTAANTLITGNAEFLVGENLHFLSMGDVIPRKDRWWGATKDSEHPIGWSRTIRFGGAVCVRGPADLVTVI